jgi:hypothetical protein
MLSVTDIFVKARKTLKNSAPSIGYTLHDKTGIRGSMITFSKFDLMLNLPNLDAARVW